MCLVCVCVCRCRCAHVSPTKRSVTITTTRLFQKAESSSTTHHCPCLPPVFFFWIFSSCWRAHACSVDWWRRWPPGLSLPLPPPLSLFILYATCLVHTLSSVLVSLSSQLAYVPPNVTRNDTAASPPLSFPPNPFLKHVKIPYLSYPATASRPFQRASKDVLILRPPSFFISIRTLAEAPSNTSLSLFLSVCLASPPAASLAPRYSSTAQLPIKTRSRTAHTPSTEYRRKCRTLS